MTLANIFHYRFEFKDKIPTREPTKAPAKWQNITNELVEKIEKISEEKYIKVKRIYKKGNSFLSKEEYNIRIKSKQTIPLVPTIEKLLKQTQITPANKTETNNNNDKIDFPKTCSTFGHKNKMKTKFLARTFQSENPNGYKTSLK